MDSKKPAHNPDEKGKVESEDDWEDCDLESDDHEVIKEASDEDEDSKEDQKTGKSNSAFVVINQSEAQSSE